jgi:hypothetical protein
MAEAACIVAAVQNAASERYLIIDIEIDIYQSLANLSEIKIRKRILRWRWIPRTSSEAERMANVVIPDLSVPSGGRGHLCELQRRPTRHHSIALIDTRMSWLQDQLASISVLAEPRQRDPLQTGAILAHLTFVNKAPQNDMNVRNRMGAPSPACDGEIETRSAQ